MTCGEPSANTYEQDNQSPRRKTSGTCARCGGAFADKPTYNSVGTGYAVMDLGDGPVHVCYKCCAHYDKEWMREHWRITLYLVPHIEICNVTRNKVVKYTVTNWPGSLEFDCHSWAISEHNWGLIRTDVWFKFEGHVWHGVNIGDTSQLVHCKRTKKKV